LFEFAPVENRAVVASFDGGRMTTDAGALLVERFLCAHAKPRAGLRFIWMPPTIRCMAIKWAGSSKAITMPA
jgi:hypothetical protein